jgi:DNA transposition AAA+ family ATPase
VFVPAAVRDLTDDGLLERSAVLGALQRSLTEVAAGQGRLVMLSGEAGVGKTAVLRSFTGRAGVATRHEASTATDAGTATGTAATVAARP